MKTYVGGRSLAGAEVTVDGRKLDPRFDLKRLSPSGFEWTYEGAGPAQAPAASSSCQRPDFASPSRITVRTRGPRSAFCSAKPLLNERSFY